MDLCLFGKKITHTQIIVNHYENSETLMCVLLFILLTHMNKMIVMSKERMKSSNASIHKK